MYSIFFFSYTYICNFFYNDTYWNSVQKLVCHSNYISKKYIYPKPIGVLSKSTERVRSKMGEHWVRGSHSKAASTPRPPSWSTPAGTLFHGGTRGVSSGSIAGILLTTTPVLPGCTKSAQLRPPRGPRLLLALPICISHILLCITVLCGPVFYFSSYFKLLEGKSHVCCIGVSPTQWPLDEGQWVSEQARDRGREWRYRWTLNEHINEPGQLGRRLSHESVFTLSETPILILKTSLWLFQFLVLVLSKNYNKNYKFCNYVISAPCFK